MDVVLDRFGRILIPKRIRERVGLKSGMSLKLDVRGRTVQLTPVEQEPLFDSGGVLVFGGNLAGDAELVFEELEQERIRKLAGI